mmetsp:Transcript_29205/g.70456  ORF Transcript_29205/g.70456 Transcript_29205/m.70456 type:complete len:218 (-) Transcript_29205:290-943(-)
MHEAITAFPSNEFYNGKLITPDIIRKRPNPPWYSLMFPPMCFWDTNGSNMTTGATGHGYTNHQETDFITRALLTTLCQGEFLNRSGEVTVGIISFYKHQVKLLKDQISRIPALDDPRLNIKVATVDGFQGSECDIIILSCVRSHPRSGREGPRRNSVGFLNDYRRVNVALTRAKSSLWIVGNSEVLRASELWRKLIYHMADQKLLRHDYEFRDMIIG